MSPILNTKKDYINRVIRTFTRRDCSPAVEKEVHTWLADDTDRAAKDEAMDALWSDAAAHPGLSRRHTDTAWHRFASANGLLLAPCYVSLRRLRIWQAAAAVMALVTVGAFLFTRSQEPVDIIQQHTAKATVNTFLLPDGTEVLLNSGSTLMYPERFEGDERCVYLIGQGSFNVSHDKRHPFIVKSDNFQVTALGTEFDINAYPDDDEVTATLIEGSVKVEYSDLTEKAILHPGQQLVFNKRTSQALLRHADIDDITAWQYGEMVFTDLTVPDILRTIERKFDYRFSYSPAAFADDRYTFRFPQNAPLPEVMGIISDVSGGRVRYSITGKDCHVTYQ